VILVVILVVETTILAIIMVNWSLGNQNFPKFSFNPPIAANCATLTSHQVSKNNDNRTVLFDCSTLTTTVAAFRVFAPLTLRYYPEGGKPDLAKPVFRLPAGYLNLSLTSDGDYGLTCLLPGAVLVSGRSMYIGESNYAGVYDYCAVISNVVSQVESFSIQWVEGTPPPPSPSYAVSASSYHLTIPAGQTGSCTLTITSYNGFNGTLAFTSEVHPFVPMNVTGLPFVTLQQSSIFLPANGVVRVEATIFTSSNTTTATGYLAWVWAQSGGGKNGVMLDISVT
jgi:hypothetical protein